MALSISMRPMGRGDNDMTTPPDRICSRDSYLRERDIERERIREFIECEKKRTLPGYETLKNTTYYGNGGR